MTEFDKSRRILGLRLKTEGLNRNRYILSDFKMIYWFLLFQAIISTHIQYLL